MNKYQILSLLHNALLYCKTIIAFPVSLDKNPCLAQFLENAFFMPPSAATIPGFLSLMQMMQEKKAHTLRSGSGSMQRGSVSEIFQETEGN